MQGLDSQLLKTTRFDLISRMAIWPNVAYHEQSHPFEQILPTWASMLFMYNNLLTIKGI